MNKLLIWLAASLLTALDATYSYAQNSEPVIVDGPLVSLLDKFSDGEPLSEDRWWIHTKTPNMTWINMKKAPMRYVELGTQNNHFVAERYFNPAESFSTGCLRRNVHFSIAGRVENESYLISVQQGFSIKTGERGDLEANRVTAEMYLACSDTPVTPIQDRSVWRSNLTFGTWESDRVLSMSVRIVPGMCPGNNLIISQTFSCPQDLVLNPTELAILTIRN
jgi:hypothetical protein